MFRGLYAAATALDAAQMRHEVTAHNMVNANTPGFRQQGVRFETFNLLIGRDQPPPPDIVGTRLAAGYTDFRPAALQATGNPFDLALGEPDHFFAVQGPAGTLYTRNGTFRLTPQGQLVTAEGYPLQGESGPVVVPAGAANVNIASDGNVTADGGPVGRVRVVRFADPTQLSPAGPTAYSAAPAVQPQEATGRVVQGFREGSNVNPTEAMVGMIATTRYYEAAQRALRAIAESVQLNTRPQG